MAQHIPETITEEEEEAASSVEGSLITEKVQETHERTLLEDETQEQILPSTLNSETIEEKNEKVFELHEKDVEFSQTKDTDDVLKDPLSNDEQQLLLKAHTLDTDSSKNLIYDEQKDTLEEVKPILYSLKSVEDLKDDIAKEEDLPTEEADLPIEEADLPTEEAEVSDTEPETPDGTAEVEKEPVIDRNAYVEQYKSLVAEKTMLRRKNLLLQKKLIEYFDKHKLIFKEEDSHSIEEEQKYHKKLFSYEEMRKKEEEERLITTADLEKKKEECEKLRKEMENEINSLLEHEKEIGLELANSKIKKSITTKMVDDFLDQQRKKIEEVNNIRLNYIKICEKLAEKTSIIKELEYIGDGLHMIDYEQLQMEQQSYIEKIDERERELQKLSLKFSSAIQALAHIKEKSHLTQAKTDKLKLELLEIEENLNQAREHVTTLKKHRDDLQKSILKLEREAGLLMETKLLRDFDESLEEANRLSAQLQNLKNSYHDGQQKLNMNRKSLANMSASLADGLSETSYSSSRVSSIVLPKRKRYRHRKNDPRIQK